MTLRGPKRTKFTSFMSHNSLLGPKKCDIQISGLMSFPEKTEKTSFKIKKCKMTDFSKISV
jgi:hypothetical protein